MTPTASRAAAGAADVKLTSSVAQNEGRAFGQPVTVNGIEAATIGRLCRFDWKAGSDDALARLDGDGAIVDSALAAKHHLQLGSASRSSRPKAGPSS